jgi:hypothetical protein
VGFVVDNMTGSRTSSSTSISSAKSHCIKFSIYLPSIRQGLVQWACKAPVLMGLVSFKSKKKKKITSKYFTKSVLKILLRQTNVHVSCNFHRNQVMCSHTCCALYESTVVLKKSISNI